jgi:hypothetical protein
MRKTAVAMFLILAGIPCFGQRTEVEVRSAEMVQVSTGEESPNITRVGSVTVYYISCSYVIYCGPPLSTSEPNT